jgi:hypothetical protein
MSEAVAAAALVIAGVLAFVLAVRVGIVLGKRLDRIMVARAASEEAQQTQTRADGGRHG